MRLFTATVLRAAAFRRLNTDLFGSRISPSTVAGFVLDRNELFNADRREAGVSLETEHARTFASIRAFYRRTELPLLAITPVSATDRTSRASGASAYFDWILSRRWSLFADDQFVRTGTDVLVHRDNEVRAGVNFIHERGFFARVATSWIAQHFFDTDIPELSDSGYSLTDLSFNYEFARKRARATLEVTNLFDRSFTSFVEGLSVGLPSPERRAIGRFSYRF